MIYKAVPPARNVYIYIFEQRVSLLFLFLFFGIFNRTVGDKRSIKRLKIVKMWKKMLINGWEYNLADSGEIRVTRN